MITATVAVSAEFGSQEQPALGGEVVLDGLVVVQVILREVGEGDRVELDAERPAQIERVRRHLHDHAPVPGRDHIGQVALDIKGLGGRSPRRQASPADTPLHGAHEPCL